MDNELVPIDSVPDAITVPDSVPLPTQQDKAELEEECLQCWLEGGDI